MPYVLIHAGSYPDDASSYVAAKNRAEVEEAVVDFGWLENPGMFVYWVPRGVAPADYAVELAGSPDPYPDFVVDRGPRGGIRWVHA